MRAAVAVLVAGLLFGVAAPRAEAEPWYAGRAGHRRALHLAVATTGGLLYLSTETVLLGHLAPVDCRWCEPNQLDRPVRNALVWSNPGRAATISNIVGYAAAPALAFALVLVETPPGTANVFDDALPIFEAVLAGQAVTQVAKFSVGRQRPGIYFSGNSQPHENEDNLSFFSGHSSLTFSVAAAAGTVASTRHYKTAPYIWVTGMTLAATTGYLRIAADKHYLTDVMTGAAVGIAAGLLVPRLLLHGMQVVPAPDGVALAGRW